MKTMTAREVQEEGKILEQKLERECFLAEDGTAVILTAGGYHYEIDLDRCSDTSTLLGWVLHLNGKAWMYGSLMNRFIQIASKANSIVINRNS